MKKKILLTTFLLLAMGGGGYIAYLFFLQPTDSFRPIYLVPKDAIYILETDEPVKSWQQISGSGFWKHLQQNDYIASMTEGANNLTQLIEANPLIFEAIGSRQVLIAAHMTRANDYGFLYVIDLKETSKLSALRNYLQNFTGKSYQLTKRLFEGHEILELTNLETKDMLSLSIINNQLVLSYTHLLVEKAIEQMEKPFIGRDLYFTDVSRKVAGDGMFRFYIQHAVLDEYLSVYLDGDEEALKPLSESLHYSAFRFEMKDENSLLKATGFTNLRTGEPSYLHAMAESGDGKLEILQVAPERTGFYLGLGFDSFWEFFENMEKTLASSDTAAYQEYLASIDKLENFLDISIQTHFLEWIDDEIALIQTQPSGLGRDNELAVVLKAKSAKKALENLIFISEQVRKKTPVRFKSVHYQGFDIRFLSIKGFFRLLLGKLFAKLDRPYYTLIGDFVIFSNHPQTLRSIIDDFNDGRTLGRNKQFRGFLEEFETSSSVFAYVQTPVMLNNLQQFVGAETWRDLQKNEEYIACFSHVGFQLVPNGSIFDTRLALQFQPIEEVEQGEKEALARLRSFQFNLKRDTLAAVTDVEDEEIMTISEILPDDLAAKKHQEFFENDQLKVEVSLKDGMKHGAFREYYESGALKIKGRYKEDKMTGVWKMYDEEGNVVERTRYKDGKKIR